jgi:hypothetical protein
MNNKKISFLIINEDTKKNHTFSLSFFSTKIIIVSVLIFILFIGNICIKYYSNAPMKKQLAEIHITEQKIKTMMELLIDKDIISDSILYQFELLDDYNNLNNFLPISKPVEGFITRGIINDTKKPHHGLDIAAIFKSDVKAVQKGLVILSDQIDYLGNTIIIAHANNYYSLYAHMNKRLIANREFVEKNQIIGEVGKSENDDGPHLHFEIWHNNVIIDPRDLIKEYKIKDVSIR